MDSGPSPAPYHLTVDGFPAGHFRVHAIRGTEALSEAWSFDVTVTAETSDVTERSALGQRAVLVLDVREDQRAFHGVVAAVRLAEVHHASHAIKYRLRIVPRMWLLRRRQRTRIFQNMRVPDIVATVLREAGIAVRFQLVRAYPAREYCTQYEETDYRFVKRILAEAGMYFYFPEGPPPDGAALAAGAAFGAAAAAGGALLDSTLGQAAGSLLGSAASLAEPLIPGDTVICADDAASYPAMNGDDAGVLAASTAAALATALGPADGLAGAVAGGVSAVAGAVISGVAGASHAVPVLPFLPSGGTSIARDDKIVRFELDNTVRSTAATFRDYDPERPMVRLQSTAVSTEPFPPSPFEAAAALAAAAENAAAAAASAVPGAAAGIAVAESVLSTAAGAVSQVGGALGQKVPFEVYEHHGPFLFPKWSFASDEAPRILRQKRRRASIAGGESGCSDLCPGHRFRLEGHPAPHLDGEYVVTRVEHRGEIGTTTAQSWKVYENAFECAPASMTYVPPRPKRSSVQVALTATVVAPAGEEIHVDAMGQIKVQFHWDRDGRYDGRSSCWIRTMQPWGGAGWGVQFIPRVGMEVVVTFEGGDPDKPIVLGSLYNGTHPSPFVLPRDKTRSGWRTQSSPGGGGFNELSFEDSSRREQIYLHAQRNLDEVIENNHTMLVRNDEFLRVLGQRLDKIEKNLEEHIGGDHMTHVQGNRVEAVAGNSDERVSGTRVTRVEGKERRNVQGQADFEHADDLTTRVQGCMTTLVGKNDKKRSWITHAEGIATLSSTDTTRVTSDKELVLAVGKSAIRITADKIEIVGAAITTSGEGGAMSVGDSGLTFKSKDGARVEMGEKMLLKTAGASLSMGKEIKADATKILLNSPDKANDESPKEPEPPTGIALTDQDGNKLAHRRFLIVLDDGSEVSGMTGEDGSATLELASGGKVQFPDLTMPGDEPRGPLLPHVIRQGEYLAKLAFSHGFDAEKVWNDPKNAELKEKRKTPNMLHPGDVVHFPRAKREGLPLKKGTSNSYSAKVPKTAVRLGFKSEDGPYANEPYIVKGLGAELSGNTDGEGMLTLDVPVHTREVQVVFPKRDIVYPVRIGDMDPIDEPTGVRKRLEHLGHRAPTDESSCSEAEADARDRRAIAAFQKAQGLPETGILDDATKAALVKAHGS